MRCKAAKHNIEYKELYEMLFKSTQTCSHCLVLTGSRGLRGLSVSDWECKTCGRHHKRNENSADNHKLAYKNWKKQ